jgi:hypothetical protein
VQCGGNDMIGILSLTLGALNIARRLYMTMAVRSSLDSLKCPKENGSVESDIKSIV